MNTEENTQETPKPILRRVEPANLKDRLFCIRMSKELRAHIDAAAAEAGITPSKWAHDMIAARVGKLKTVKK